MLEYLPRQKMTQVKIFLFVPGIIYIHIQNHYFDIARQIA